MILRRAGPVLFAGLLTLSCGARLMKLPSGPGGPAPDITQVFAEATGACQQLSSITAEVGVSGSVGGRRLRARLIVGLEAPASARLEAFAFGQQIFIVVVRGGDATLLLTRENRILEHGRADEILEAVAGIPLDASDLRTTLAGCPPQSAGASSRPGTGPGAARQIGDDWRVAAEEATEMYFHRESRERPWRLVAAVRRDPKRPAWRVEYRSFENNLPRTIRMTSTESSRFDLRLALSQVELNAKLPSAAFEVKVPSSADPITIEELRRNGPLGQAERGAAVPAERVRGRGDLGLRIRGAGAPGSKIDELRRSRPLSSE